MVRKKQNPKKEDKVVGEIVTVLEKSQLPEEIIRSALNNLDKIIEVTKEMKSRVDILNAVLNEIAYS